MKKNTFNIGTSGWSYAGWLGNFYPEKIKSTLILPYYANHLDSVELNNSFYQIPSTKNITRWKDITPDNFIFSCKANRYITHFKKLEDTSETLERLLHAFSHFEEKLGPILFQFPPYWAKDIERLKQFIKQLPEKYLYTFEFRHKSWFCEELYELLHQYSAALCFYDHKLFRSPEVVTGDFIYIRMHGPNATAYQGAYEESTLEEYAKKLVNWHKDGKAIYCYFDNDEKANAPKDAQRLRALLCTAST
ncbi:DUF72 domain-containing protein [Legionella sp. km772]|uniref:DUF72 domain-containing protein n=1 Tax=Legionella sp. km772 TaxID=2498111 RepID=UPI000F8C6FE3|nr:DUF72 domain-containing protein [Legionella sp. km772]RUR09384.1 DUF72 domain-containing protein [Legionella sp. km772]